MSRKKIINSRKWFREHKKDVYVRKSHKFNLRSRAWFKLQEIDKACNLIKKNMCILDLGSSPGGWSKYIVEKFNYQNEVVACDIHWMKPIRGVQFFQGDLKNKTFMHMIVKYLRSKKVKLVTSDMAPNISGKSYIDVVNSISLAQLALTICSLVLIANGSFIVKIFQGEGINEYLKLIRQSFVTVKIRKPNSSRTRSKELFIVAEGWVK